MKYQMATAGTRELSTRSLCRRDFAFGNVMGESRGIRGAVDYARKLATSGFDTILLVGEPGTGKGLFARAIHYAGQQADRPFVSVDCGVVPAEQLESELFGHEAGAFDGAEARKAGLLELAGDGTVFLDGIGHLPPVLQPKLMRALDERRARRVGGLEEFEVRCAVVAGSTTPLEEDVAEGTFREDLFYTLNGLRITLPPLRERAGDVEILAKHFLDEIVRQHGLEPKLLADEAVTALESHHWPGNVRELKSVIRRAAVVCGNPRVFAKHLRIQDRRSYPLVTQPPVGEIKVPPGGATLDEIEAEALRLTLEMTAGNQSAAARVLGISRPTLLRKARKYGLEPMLRLRLAV